MKRETTELKKTEFDSEKRESAVRTIATLQHFHSTIIALAITSGFEKIYALHSVITGLAELVTPILLLVALISTAIPFYHGMSRHLYESHVTRSVVGKMGNPPPLLLDIVVFIIESGILLLMSRSLEDPLFFLFSWVALLAVDILWSISIWNYHNNSEPVWVKNNLIHVSIAFIVWLFWDLFLSASSGNSGGFINFLQVAFVFILEISRSIFDYKKHWRFYFPV